MSIKGVDCSTVINRTIAADLVRSGYSFICRYLAPLGLPKILTRAEAQAASGAGLDIASVYESTADRARYGANNGLADGAIAFQESQALNMPASAIIYFAADFEATASEMDNIEAYLRAARTQTGDYEVGVYGSFAVVEEMGNRGSCRGFWQTYAWSPNGAVSQYAMIYQYKNDQVAAGISVDLDEAYGNAGMWSYREEIMDQKTFNGLYDTVNPVIKTIADVPSCWKAEVQALLDKNAINGGTDKSIDPSDINLRLETLIAVIVAARADK